MLYTNYYGCCTIFQTTIKNCRAPHLKSTDLIRIQVTTCSLAAAYKFKQRYCTMLANVTGNCVVANVIYSDDKYYAVT